MLIQPNKTELGDRNVKDAESVAKLKEKIQHQRDKDKLPNQEMLNNQEMAVGNALAPADFIRQLLKLPGILVEQGGLPNAVAVRVFAHDEDPTSPTFGQNVKRYVSGFYIDRMLPEYSSYVNDRWGVPQREIRGWRSVLLTLLRAKAVTYKQVKAVFGEPNGQRNILWRAQTQDKK